MSFSLIWDTGFKALMIYIGTVFVWLCFIEAMFADRSLSVTVMNIVGIALACGFFVTIRRRSLREKVLAEAEIAALMKEVE